MFQLAALSWNIFFTLMVLHKNKYNTLLQPVGEFFS